MVLSETEAEAQLAGLRRQREALDRAIADLSLYLELGRRLTAAPGPPAETAAALPPQLGPRPSPDRDALRPIHPVDGVPPPASPPPVPGRDLPAAIPGAAAASHRPQADAPPPDGARSDALLSDGVLARRYGRALIEAALAALEEAGRPLHAAEILAVLTGRGFSLPGHDPVAALNTRLWKRSGPGGPLTRMGDAVYALAEPEEERSDPGFR